MAPVALMPVPHNEDGDVEDVFFRVQSPSQGVLMEVLHAVHFLSPIPSLLLELCRSKIITLHKQSDLEPRRN